MAGLGIDDGSGVLLRPARESDAERWLELLHDPDHVTYASPAFVILPTDVEGLAEHLDRSRSTWEERAPGTLVVTPADDDGWFLGNISWRWTTGELLGVADIGYGIHPDARGRGFGRRAIVSLTRWLLSPDGRGLARVQLDHSVENEASCRVALAAGSSAMASAAVSSRCATRMRRAAYGATTCACTVAPRSTELGRYG